MSAREKYCSQEVAKKVVYEFSMFEYLCDQLDRLRQDGAVNSIPGAVTLVGTGDDDREASALLESLLLHTRVLRDFFYSSRTQDDIIAGDFVDGWQALCPSKCEYLDSRKERLNKAVAHLTLKRVEYESDEKEWNVTVIRSEMGSVIEEFRASLPQERRPWFTQKQ